MKIIELLAHIGGFAAFIIGAYIILFVIISSFDGRDKKDKIKF